MVSYQYFEWTGGVLPLLWENSPQVSYFFLSGVVPPGGLSSSSEVTVSPGSAPADGQTVVTITVRLFDGNGNPVAGKMVTVSAVQQSSSGLVAGLAAMTQPANPTDDNGRTTATLTSSSAGTVIISAYDATDSIFLSSQPTVQFTPALIAPNDALSQAIAMLYRTTADNLNDSSLSISEIGMEAGPYGDDFRGAFGSDQALGVVDALFGILGICTAGGDTVEAAGQLALPGVAEAGADQLIEESGKASYLLDTGLLQGNVAANVLKSAFLQVAETARDEALNDVSDQAVETYLQGVAAQPKGLSAVAQNNAQNCVTYQQLLQQQAQSLAQGIPPLTAAQQMDWANNLALRYGYSTALVGILSHEEEFLQQFAAARQQSSDDALEWMLAKFAADAAATVFFDGPGALILGGIETVSGELGTLRSMSADQMGYDTAFSLVGGTAQYASQAYLDAASAYSEISQSLSANPVTGQIGPMIDVEEGNSLLVAVSQYFVTKASSVLYVTNTSAGDATFEVAVLSGYASSAYGVGIPSLAQVTMGVMQVGAGTYGAVPITYFDGNAGGKPDPSTPMTVYVLGNNSSGTFYVGGFSHNWNPTQGGSGSPGVRPMDLQPEIENPVSTYVGQNPTNQTYEAQIFVVNPFEQAYTAIVTQALPPAATVVTTDGVLGDSAIVWTNSIPGGGLARETFAFSLSLVPGASTNLPPATVIFVDQTNNASSPIPSVAPAFSALFPVLARGLIPTGIPGTDVPLVVTVTNWTSTESGGHHDDCAHELLRRRSRQFLPFL